MTYRVGRNHIRVEYSPWEDEPYYYKSPETHKITEEDFDKVFE